MAIDGVSEHVEHARKNCFVDRHFQCSARVHDDRAARQTLSRRQRNAAHPMRVELRQNLDDDSSFFTSARHRTERRQILIEPYIHGTTAQGDDAARGNHASGESKVARGGALFMLRAAIRPALRFGTRVREVPRRWIVSRRRSP